MHQINRCVFIYGSKILLHKIGNKNLCFEQEFQIPAFFCRECAKMRMMRMMRKATFWFLSRNFLISPHNVLSHQIWSKYIVLVSVNVTKPLPLKAMIRCHCAGMRKNAHFCAKAAWEPVRTRNLVRIVCATRAQKHEFAHFTHFRIFTHLFQPQFCVDIMIWTIRPTWCEKSRFSCIISLEIIKQTFYKMAKKKKVTRPRLEPVTDTIRRQTWKYTGQPIHVTSFGYTCQCVVCCAKLT